MTYLCLIEGLELEIKLIRKGLAVMKKRILQALAIWHEARVKYRNRYLGHRLGS